MAHQTPVVGPVWNEGAPSASTQAEAREQPFTYNRCSVDACDQFCTRAITIVVFQQEFPGFLIQGGFRVGIDQQAFDRHEYMTNAIRRLPILLQRVDTNLACGGDVWVEDLRGEPA